MTTLMSVTTGNSEGSRTRRCDANCYNAHGRTCTCVCSGKNHGAGLAQAKTNTESIANEFLKRLQQAKPDQGVGIALAEFDRVTHFPASVLHPEQKSLIPGA